jgi:hypothetical protein
MGAHVLREAELLENVEVLLVDLVESLLAGRLPRIADLGGLLVVGGSLLDAGLLELLNDVVVLPANVLAHVAHDGVGALALVAAEALSLGDHNAGTGAGHVRRDTLVRNEGAESLLAALGVAGEHGADGADEDIAGGAVVEGAELRVGELSLAEEVQVLDLVTDLSASNRQLLAADDGDLLAQKQLLGNDGGSATEDVVLQINRDDVGAVLLGALAQTAVYDLAASNDHSDWYTL